MWLQATTGSVPKLIAASEGSPKFLANCDNDECSKRMGHAYARRDAAGKKRVLHWRGFAALFAAKGASHKGFVFGF
jgi:hypothetical protein